MSSEQSAVSETSNSTPLLSVYVLNYNYAHYLATCIDSILGQTFRDLELIIINDRSTDNSLDVIEPYLADPRVRLVDHDVNLGFTGSLIEGVELSRGEYVCVVSADDWMADPEAFELMVGRLEANPNAAMAFGAHGTYFTDTGHSGGLHRAAEADFVRPGIDLLPRFAMQLPSHSGSVVRRLSYDAMGGYDTKYRWSLDNQLFLFLCMQGDIIYIDRELQAYRRHPLSMSHDVKSLRAVHNEQCDVLDRAFDMLSDADRERLDWARQKAKRTFLTSSASDAAFSGKPRLAWRFLIQALRANPRDTLLQRSTAAIVLRTTLGARGYRTAERLLVRAK